MAIHSGMLSITLTFPPFMCLCGVCTLCASLPARRIAGFGLGIVVGRAGMHEQHCCGEALCERWESC